MEQKPRVSRPPRVGRQMVLILVGLAAIMMAAMFLDEPVKATSQARPDKPQSTPLYTVPQSQGTPAWHDKPPTAAPEHAPMVYTTPHEPPTDRDRKLKECQAIHWVWQQHGLEEKASVLQTAQWCQVMGTEPMW